MSIFGERVPYWAIYDWAYLSQYDECVGILLLLIYDYAHLERRSKRLLVFTPFTGACDFSFVWVNGALHTFNCPGGLGR